MNRYQNNFGILAFTIDGKDYISNKGDEIELPDCRLVNSLEAKRHIIKLKTKKK